MASRSHHRFRSDTAFLDMLFNMTLAFAFLLIITLMVVNPTKKADANINIKAEFVLTLVWPDGSADDVDIWLLGPDGSRTYYLNKDTAVATLDRDDRGMYGDAFDIDPADPSAGKKLNRQNNEIVTIRGIQPGKYAVAAYLFAEHKEVHGFKPDTVMPYAVNLTMTKLNPKVTDVLKSTATLSRSGQEVVFASFSIDADGNIFDVEQNPSMSIVTITRRALE